MSFQHQPDPQSYARVRSNTWPGIENEATAEARPSLSRRNAWGSLSYADLITRAITASPNQKATLTQIYDWLIENVPYFRQKSDKASSAGWKNSIRHNLSLHSKFMKVQHEVTGKSSWWMINHQAKEKPGRRRCATMDSQKVERKRQNVKKRAETLKKIKEEVPPNPPWNQQCNTPQLQRTQSFVQTGPSTSSYVGNTTNQQTDQNYNHLVASFQYGMTLYYPSTPISHVNSTAMVNMSQLNNSAMSAVGGGSTQSQNSSNVDDLIMDLNPIHLPFEIDVEGIIKKELEIDGRLDFV